MPGSVSNFKSQFTTDLARPSRFDVFIAAPSDFGTGMNISKLSWRCEIAQLPGRHFTTTEQKTYGPYEKFPYHSTYNDIDLTFIIDGDMKIKSFFDSWLDLVNPTNSWDVAYKDDYKSLITINQYDITNKLSYSISLMDAFPMSMNQMDLDWANSDGVHKLVVTFAYTYWINNLQNTSTPPPTQTPANYTVNSADSSYADPYSVTNL